MHHQQRPGSKKKDLPLTRALILPRLQNSCLQRKARHTLLKETNNLVCSCDTRVVVCLQCLCTHLLLGEDAALAVLIADQRLHLLNVLGRHIGEVAKILPCLENFQQFSFVDHFWSSSVDQSATRRHSRKQLLVDGLLSLRSQRHMKAHVLVIEKFCTSCARLGQLHRNHRMPSPCR